MRAPTDAHVILEYASAGPPTLHSDDPLQLALDLREGDALVWGGRSPRVLTRAYKKFRLEPLPPGGLPEE